MEKIYELVDALEVIGHRFMGISFAESGMYMIYAHNPKLPSVGSRPVREFCRDDVDYRLRLNQWNKNGTYLLYGDKDLDVALNNALLKVRK